jgi:hypothetical protein
MQLLKELPVREFQRPIRDFITPTTQAIVVYKPVREQHDIRIHAILEPQVHDGLWMRL